MNVPSSPIETLTWALDAFVSFSKTPQFFEIALANHCLFVANNLLRDLTSKSPRRKIGLLAGFLLCLVGGFGGSLILNTINGKGIGSFLFSDDRFLVYMFSAWFLVLYAPFNLVNLLTSNVLFSLPSLLLEGFFVSGFILAGVEQGYTAFPKSHLAPIIFGTLAFSGGLFIQPSFLNAYLGVDTFRSLASNPSHLFYIPLLASIYHYLCNIIHVLPDVVKLPVHIPEVPFDSISVRSIIQIAIILQFAYLWFSFSFLPLFTSSKATPVKRTEKPEKLKTSEVGLDAPDTKSTSASPGFSGKNLTNRKKKKR